MREIKAEVLEATVRDLLIQANTILPEDAVVLIRDSYEKESFPLAKAILKKLDENLEVAKSLHIPICQDTGMAVLFLEVGSYVHIVGNFEAALQKGVHRAYLEGYLRCSVVRDPLFDRVNTGDNTPAIIHTRLVEGDKIKITVAPKGFGSENMSQIKMFTPSATKEDILAFVVSVVKTAGGNPCPPVLVGVGIGGTFEYCAYLSKKALTRNVSERNSNPNYAQLEQEMLDALNQLQIGAQGFGGDVSAFAVNIETAPTHIAGLPVAVNINCHVMRHAEAIL